MRERLQMKATGLTISLLIGASALLMAPSPSLSASKGWQQIENGVLFYESSTKGASEPIRLWFYLPQRRKGKIPCIFIPPAGSAMFHGMNLSDSDRSEHLPYVKAGFAVVAFEIEGPLPDKASPTQVITAATMFKNADGGVIDGQAAINAALRSLSDIEPSKLMVAGHSSAGTTALALAAKDKRIRACAAFAPCTDISAALGNLTNTLSKAIPGFQGFVHRFSPDKNTKDLKCPVFIFNAADDDTVSPNEVASYFKLLRSSNTSAISTTVNNGGHYQAMINNGIPAAIKFFKDISK